VIVYQPGNWYWVVAGSTLQVYGSQSNALVANTDPTYQAWVAQGGTAAATDTFQSLAITLGHQLNPPYGQIQAFGRAIATPATLSDLQFIQQMALDAIFNQNFNLGNFIMQGTVTSVTGTQLANFLAQITNNYRTLRAQIAACTTKQQVGAIDITSGWPANP
jgi:hypothetical protein